MAFTSAGLPNDWKTDHYQISYDSSLSAVDGVNRANGLMANCEQDWNLMASWFPGVKFNFDFPIAVQITTGSGGASWTDPRVSKSSSGTALPCPSTRVQELR